MSKIFSIVYMIEPFSFIGTYRPTVFGEPRHLLAHRNRATATEHLYHRVFRRGSHTCVLRQLAVRLEERYLLEEQQEDRYHHQL